MHRFDTVSLSAKHQKLIKMNRKMMTTKKRDRDVTHLDTRRTTEFRAVRTETRALQRLHADKTSEQLSQTLRVKGLQKNGV
jgi:hypothetical protein